MSSSQSDGPTICSPGRPLTGFHLATEGAGEAEGGMCTGGDGGVTGLAGSGATGSGKNSSIFGISDAPTTDSTVFIRASYICRAARSAASVIAVARRVVVLPRYASG